MFKRDEKVAIVDVNKVKGDSQLDVEAKKILEANEYQGYVTKTFEEDGKLRTAVTFYTPDNRLTQVFNEDEIKKVGE
ncbi:hypothetical protein HB999_07350 [Listeria booriae]|uniref:hypothetical protein n=1 Tax=Listeria booriae TaxID=1552123 RepID=UPI00164DFFD2|nr:hypothetical protein [Listeria booriae]MBC6163282.1 hypothetical protein [Listeria booriae]